MKIRNSVDTQNSHENWWILAVGELWICNKNSKELKLNLLLMIKRDVTVAPWKGWEQNEAKNSSQSFIPLLRDVFF